MCCRVQLFAIPWTVAFQAPLSMGFSRQEFWSGLSFFPPGALPDTGQGWDLNSTSSQLIRSHPNLMSLTMGSVIVWTPGKIAIFWLQFVCYPLLQTTSKVMVKTIVIIGLLTPLQFVESSARRAQLLMASSLSCLLGLDHARRLLNSQS